MCWEILSGISFHIDFFLVRKNFTLRKLLQIIVYGAVQLPYKYHEPQLLPYHCDELQNES